MTEIPLLTFDKLFDLVEENQFENEIDRNVFNKLTKKVKTE
ncbi:hypothetical protein Lacal_0582 [Lacinutrix sp. 5H-3-7-4]|nr:hypothetical protein Lacal_0582 [Lacinutrix sp. 5H-3-7-4]